jgi:periplasmic protein CpxP/Spy
LIKTFNVTASVWNNGCRADIPKRSPDSFGEESGMLKIKTLLIVLFVFGVSMIAGAQDLDDLKNSTPEDRAEFLTDWMKTELKLDNGQTAAVQKINLNYSQKNQEVFNSDGSRLRKLRKLKELAKEKDKELKNVLTQDQYAKYQAKKDELKEKIKERKR